jgi:hypothetical protein
MVQEVTRFCGVFVGASAWWTDGTQFKTRVMHFFSYLILAELQKQPKIQMLLAGKLITWNHSYNKHGKPLAHFFKLLELTNKFIFIRVLTCKPLFWVCSTLRYFWDFFDRYYPPACTLFLKGHLFDVQSIKKSVLKRAVSRAIWVTDHISVLWRHVAI